MEENKPKYTKAGLPVVKEGILNPIKKDLKIRKEKEYLEKILEEIKKENPLLGSIIAIDSPELTKRENRWGKLVGAIVYKCLKSQTEANQMDYQFEE